MSDPRDAAGWLRLDPRMLLVGPVRVAKQFAIPAVIALIGVGTSDARWSFVLLPVLLVGALLLGAVPWLTTYHRVTATQLQVRRGLMHRTVVTAPLDRVRSVDLESSLLQRALGLTTVQIGTGVDDTRIELDGLARRQADLLRSFLLRKGPTVPGAPEEADQPGPPPPAELARIDWSWLRFAPFSLSRLVIVAGAVGALSQFVDDVPLMELESAWQWLGSQALPLLLFGIAVACLVGWLAISVGGYVLRWWDLRLVREDGNLRLTAGLFTTRSTTVEEARVRGIELIEPALLRVVGGAELSTLATGVGSGGVTRVLPPCPAPVARRVGRAVLEDERPVDVPLVRHGSFARRRCHLRALSSTLFAGVFLTAGAIGFEAPQWLLGLLLVVLGVLGVLTGELGYRNLGHQLTEGHLVSASGAWQRTRTVLERDGIIGWVVQQSLFQRRLGLATLVATTAAGSERVVVVDVPHAAAVRLADAATPGLLTEFLVVEPSSGAAR